MIIYKCYFSMTNEQDNTEFCQLSNGIQRKTIALKLGLMSI